jgi:uncharacterized Ntn-hydrolase superfamily protein
MTFSIVGRSADGKMYGVAVASKFLGVGALVPAADPDAGALASQAEANLAYRPQGLVLLATGTSAADTVAGLLAADPGRAVRQVGVVDRQGRGATYTGAECNAWAGGVAGDGYAIQGNVLYGPEVVEAMRSAWIDAGDEIPLSRKLLAALRAGDAAGGDRRGRQSAALLVVAKNMGYGGVSDVLADLRVDDHTDPVSELARLLESHAFYFDRPDPASLLPLTGEVSGEVRLLLAQAGHVVGPDAVDLDRALASWAGIENLEGRLAPGYIDPLVLTHLRGAAG